MTHWCILATPGEAVADHLRDIVPKLESVAGWRVRFETRSLLLFATDEVQLTLCGTGKGARIGACFDYAGNATAAELGDLETFGLRHWGSYVAFRDTAAAIEVLADLSGLSCYRARIGRLHVLTPNPRLLVRAGLLRPTIYWTAVAQFLARRDERTECTMLHEISEVCAATLLVVSPTGESRRRVWDASRHTRGSSIVTPEALSETIDRCAAAWAGIYRKPLIEVSGGLDSAIVAAALAPKSKRPTLITFAAAPGDPVETGYARAIADRLGLPLEVAAPGVADVDLSVSTGAGLPRPTARAFTQAGDLHSHRYARHLEADCFASGGGGDDVFCYLRSSVPALDRLASEGLGRGVGRTIYDIACMTETTVWEVMAQMRRRYATRDRPQPIKPDLRFLRPLPDGLAGPPDRQDSMVGLTGKSAHVRAVTTLPNHLEGQARSASAPIISLLMSRPIVEFCLGVPSWRWCEGGRNRALARDAFRGRLPQPVLERRSKGSFDGFCALLFAANRPLVRDMLLDGLLARHGIVDTDAIFQTLAERSLSAPTVMRLLALVDAEAWARSWTGTGV